MPSFLDRLRLPAWSDRQRLTLTVALAVLAFAAVVGSSIVSVVIFSGPPVDFGVFGPPGAKLLTGHWEGIFSDSIIQAGVLELVFWGIPQLMGISGAVGWAAFAVVTVSLALLLLVLLVERPLRELVSGWSVPAAVAVAALVGLTGGPVTAVMDGHPAQFAIPLLWLAAGLSARRSRPLLAAVLLGLSTGWEVWGILGAPVLLLAPRFDVRTVWRTAVGVLGAIAVLFLPFVLLGPFRMFEYSWSVNDRSLARLLLPGATGFPWPFRLAQGFLSVAAGAVVALLLRRRIDAVWLAPLAVCAVRLLFDPLLAGYYTVAPMVLVIAGLVLAVAQRSFLVAIGCLLIVNALVDFLPLSVPIVSALVLLVAVTVAVSARFGMTAQKKSGLGVVA